MSSNRMDDIFDSYEETSVDKGFGKHYYAHLGDDKYFIKSRKKPPNGNPWLIWRLRKEKMITSVLSLQNTVTPRSHFVIEDECSLQVAFDSLKDSSYPVEECYDDKNKIHALVNRLVEFRNDLNTFYSENKSIPEVSERHVDTFPENGEMQSTREYFFNNRLTWKADYYKKYQTYKPVLENASQLAEENYDDEREQLIHGDLHLGNIGFNERELLVFDWEICTVFDYLYDVATMESSIIDPLAKYNNNTTVKNIRSKFRNKLNISDYESELLSIYKIHPLYMNYEYALTSDESSTFENAEESWRQLLESEIQEFQKLADA